VKYDDKMTELKDFRDDIITQLRKDTLYVLEENDGEVYNNKLAEDHLDHSVYSLSEKSLKRALSCLRDQLEEEGEIRVEKEDTDSIAQAKLWVKT
jgi:predicted nucleic acid-binding protein